MRPNITITIPEPYITVNEYCRRSGLSERTVRNLIDDGRLPVRDKVSIKKKGEKTQKQGTVFINLAALTIEALSLTNVSLEA